MLHNTLKLFRLKADLTQAELAEKLHISQNAYSLLENGKTKIDEQRLRQLAGIFKVPVHELLGSKQFNPDSPDPAGPLMAEAIEMIYILKEQLQAKHKQIEQLLLLVQQQKIA